MRKTYDTKQAYDEDYRLAWLAINEQLPPATLTISGADIVVTPGWTRPKVGGYLTLEGDLPWTLGVGVITPHGTPHPARILSVNGPTITLEVEPSFQGTFAVTTEAGYHVPQMMLTGSNPAIMRVAWQENVNGIEPLMQGFSTPLLPGDDICLIGSGFGWETEIWVNHGYNCIGVDTSAFVNANKNVSYESEYRTILLSYGMDPDQGEGADILAQWMIGGRTASIILPADINTGQGRKAVRDAFGLSGNAKVKWMMTSFALPVLDDAEAVPLNNNMIGLADNVVHFTPLGRGPGGAGAANQDPRFNWKSLAGWKALLSPSIIIGDRYEVM